MRQKGYLNLYIKKNKNKKQDSILRGPRRPLNSMYPYVIRF